MLLITGATGHLGKATIHFLLKKGVSASNIAALVRDEAKAADLKALGITLRKGDYNDPTSLEAAFQGVDKLLLVSSSDVADRTTQHLNAVNAAQKAGVKHILYTSFMQKQGVETAIPFVAQSHIDTEKAIKDSGLTYTFLRNSLYMDVLPMFFGEKVLETGIFLPSGNGKAAYVTRLDIAEGTAQILASDGHENKIYDLTGTKTYTLHEIAAVLSELSGKTVACADPTEELYKQVMVGANVHEGIVDFLAGFSKAIKNDEFDLTDNTLESLIGRPLTTPNAYFQTVYFNQ
ncbi:MAG: SDR family oxidoreductase [Saprospiraceae bacterium]|nr:SDR family oxidoreductase [Saprospiraceae bacterium]